MPEVKDMLLFGGLGMAGTGLWQVYPPAALIICGGILSVFGFLWYVRDAGRRDQGE